MSDLNQHLVDVIASRVVRTLTARGAGHCLQVAHLPQETAEGAAALVYSQLNEPDAVALVQARPSQPWHAKSTKIVELRNRTQSNGGRLAVFLEAGQHVAAEDSFGESTFEVLELHAIYPELLEHLNSRLQQDHPDLSSLASEVLSITRGDTRFSVDDTRAASFLSRLVDDPTKDELGPALTELGLLPDSAIVAIPLDDMPVRLERNRTQIAILTSSLPPAERVRSLPLDRSDEAGRRIAAEILTVLKDGTQDQVALARRLGSPGSSELIDFKNWQVEAAKVHLEELKILQLTGDISGDAPPNVVKSNASVGVKYRVRPAAGLVAGLKELTLELLKVGEHIRDVAPAGKEATKKGKQLPQQQSAQWKLKLPDDPEEGAYVLRLRAYDEDNLLLREDVSEQFNIGEIEDAEPSSTPTASLAAARIAAQVVAGSEARVSWPPRLAVKQATKPATADGSVTVRFDEVGRAWNLHRSKLLAELEDYSIQNPDTLSWRVALESIDSLNAEGADAELPESFLEVRRQVFNAIIEHQIPVDAERTPPRSVSLSDIVPFADTIALYAESWGQSIASAKSRGELKALLGVDQVIVKDPPGAVEARLVGPTHPLRLLWLLRYRQTLDRWLEKCVCSDAEIGDLAAVVPALTPANVPNVIPGSSGVLRYMEPLDFSWGIWAPAAKGDAGALIAYARRALGLDRAGASGVRSAAVVRRIQRYLVSHPYANVLSLNFVQPGSARLVLDALLTLQEEPLTQHLRYVVRLFSKGLDRWEVGSALDEFMADPESSRVYKREAVDAFLASTDDPLAPKLTYSKHDVDDLLHDPSRYPAHLTFFLDWFDLEVVPASPLEGRRSFFAEDLVVEPVTAFSPGVDEKASPVWDQQVAVPDSPSDAFQSVFAIAERGLAQLIGATAPNQVPSVRLTLDRVRRSIFDGVHRNSDWVVTIDPVFTDEFLDTPPRAGEASRYLLDYVEPSVLEVSRRIMVSTRSRDELTRLFGPVAERYGLSVNEDRITALLEALQVLGAGLPLKLLNNRTQALEALTLAIGSLFLADQGVFRHGFVLPLDSHQDLFREAGDWRVEAAMDLRRTDLAVIRPNAERRHFGVHLVELKARKSLPAEIPIDLVTHIASQLENTYMVLRDRMFGVDLRQRTDSLASALQARRLTQLMTRYLERSLRFGFYPDAEAEDVRGFLATLDRGYTFGFDRTAILFDLSGDSSSIDVVDGVEFRRVGRRDIDDLLERAPTRLATLPAPGLPSDLFGSASVPRTQESVPAVLNVTEEAYESGEDGDSGRPREIEPVSPREAWKEGTAEGPELDEVMLIGAADTSRQFGIIGRQLGSGRSVAVDVDGTNVVSVFGLQGAGKSYTVGTLLEAALISDPHLNRLPNPLAGVVFHYSTDPRYVPEYISMASANKDPAATESLAHDFDTSPRPVPELVVLVPPDLVDERRREFGNLEVLPLHIGPQELTVDDWRLLMGLDGGEQMYARAMNTIFRQLRSNLSLSGLRSAIEASRMNQAQKDLAMMRVDFVEAFIEDGTDIASHVKPGRLLIVDLRDPYIEEDQALALFMVLLGRFEQAEDPSSGHFNKMIVFDEAHKYMRNERLTTAIVESGRLMRHTGSTIVMASQDPPSLPKKVIELSSIILSHRMTSPQWLDHLRRANEAFNASSMTISRLAQLGAGEAFVWSRNGDPEFGRPQRVRMRPRLTQHGGATRRATR